MPRLVIADQYIRDSRRCSKQIRERASDALQRFQSDSNIKGLNFEKLRGWDDLYTIRVGRNFRIVLRRRATKELGDHYVAVRIAPHDIYDRL